MNKKEEKTDEIFWKKKESKHGLKKDKEVETL